MDLRLHDAHSGSSYIKPARSKGVLDLLWLVRRGPSEFESLNLHKCEISQSSSALSQREALLAVNWEEPTRLMSKQPTLECRNWE